MPEQFSKVPEGGLWAYHRGQFHALVFTEDNKHLDHVTWFYEIGLPDYGPPFDEVLRGRMIWDWHQDHFVLSFYGTELIPNHVYEQVTRTFNAKGRKVIERSVSAPGQ